MILRTLLARLCGLAVVSFGSYAALGASSFSAAQEIAAALEPALTELGRPIHVYHYAPRANVGLPARGYIRPDDPRVRSYLKSKALFYWDVVLPTRADGMMSGLYVATDPVASRVFGGVGDEWALVRIVLREGFRYVDVRHAPPSGSSSARAIAAAAQRAGCSSVHPSQLFLAPPSESCRRLAFDTLALLDVDAVLYGYRAAPLQGCVERPEAAFLLLGDEVFDPTDTALFVVDGSDDALTRERFQINQLFTRAHEAGSARMPPWSIRRRKGQPVAHENLEEWMRSAIFGCRGATDDEPLPDAVWHDPASYWRERLESEPGSPWLRFRVAKSEFAAGNISAAIAHLRLLLSRDPDGPQILEALALALTYSASATDADREEAGRLAALLIEVSHYRSRLPTGGYRWSWIARLRHSITFARVGLAANRLEDALGYAQQAYEAAGARYEPGRLPPWLERIQDQSRELAEQIRRRRDEHSAAHR